MEQEPLVYKGQVLPRKEGFVWGILWWPGGRKELRQYTVEQMDCASEAISLLREGRIAHVWLDDEDYVINQLAAALEMR